MTNINTEFENQSTLSGVKDFDQSQDKELDILEVPLAYQEFDVIEHEIATHENSLNEVSQFAERFSDARVVRQDDIIALESLVGKLEALPNLNSYTQDYSLVNYQITQENIIVTVAKLAAKVLKAIFEFIVRTLDAGRKFIVELFDKDHYASDTATQAKIIKNVSTVTAKVEANQGVVTEKVNTLTDAQVKARIVRINKELRNLLYPTFKELGVLSRGGDINAKILVDEICEQRLKPFYSKFLDGVYHKDVNLKSFIDVYLGSISNHFDSLVLKTDDLFKSDLTQAPVNPYTRVFTTTPPEVITYIKTYGTLTTEPSRILREKDQYKVMAAQAYQTATTATSIANVLDLPEPRTLLALDLDWLSGLFDVNVASISKDLKLRFQATKKSYRNTQVNFDNINPVAKESVNEIYADWITVNKMILTLGVMRLRVSAIMHNVEKTTAIINKAIDILER